MNTPDCNVCQDGQMIRKKVYRLSGPVVVIGYILLIPSLIMALSFGGCSIAAIAFAANTGSSLHDGQVASLVELGVEQADAEELIEDPESTPLDSEKYSPELITEARAHAETLNNDETVTVVGQGIGAFFMGIIALAFFISGVVGWLLVMKKKILQCNNCQAVVNAS